MGTCPFDTDTSEATASAAEVLNGKTFGAGGEIKTGSMPNQGIDPITAACAMVTALQELPAREFAISDEAVLTVGYLNAGNTNNVIPDTARFGGTLRTFDEELRTNVKKRMEEIAKTDDDAQRIMTLPGVGAQTAVGMLVHIGGDIGRFINSGQFAASIGLVPKQNSTGGNTTLNGITKCGPKRLRANLVQCGQVILMHADKLKGNFGDWVRKLRDSGKKRGVIVCAIAAKIARIVYRLMKDKVDYTPVPSR